MIKINGNGEFEQRLREYFSEDMKGVPTIPLHRKFGDIKNVYSVDGYYRVENNALIRMIVEYRAKDFEDANRQAKENGLVHGIMVEAYLSPPQTCILGLSGEEAKKAIENDKIRLEKFLTE